jgi:hypothetical protein
MRRLCHDLLLALVLVGLSGVRGMAEEPADKAKKKDPAPKPVEAGRVYTQSDLERVIQEAKAAPTTPLPPAVPPAKPATAAVPAKPASPPKEDAPLSFSNDDLERMYGKVEPKPAPEAGPGADAAPELPDPLAEVADWQAQRTAAGLRRDQARASVQALEAQVRDFEQRATAVRNPFLPRPAAPPGQEENWDELTATQRAARIDAELADLRQQLAKARQEAAKAEAEARAAGAPPPAP